MVKKQSTCNVGDVGSIPGSGRSHGEGNGNPLQNSCLGNLTDREAWRAAVHEVAESQTQIGTHVMIAIFKQWLVATILASMVLGSRERRAVID